MYLSGLKSKYRSQIKNIKDQFKYSIAECPSKKEIDLFYSVYIRRMRTIGTLPMPKRFFYGMEKSESVFFLKVVDSHNICRAVSISIMVKDVLHLMWAASDNRQSANLFMYRELIKFCCNDSGIKFLNIGRATNNSSQYKFKERIGGRRFSIKEFSNKKFFITHSKLPKYILGFYQLVPLFFIEKLSRVIYRRFIR